MLETLQLLTVSRQGRRIDLPCTGPPLAQSVRRGPVDLQLPDRVPQPPLHERRFQRPRPISLGPLRPPPACAVEPIDEVDAPLRPFRGREGREFGEEDAPVKGAGVVVARVQGAEPGGEAAVAQEVPAGQPLGDFEVGVPGPLAQGVVGVVADGAGAVALGEVGDVDVGAGHDEG